MAPNDKISGYHRSFRKALEAGGYKTVELIEAKDIVVDKVIATAAVSLEPEPVSTWAWLASIALKFMGERRV